MRKRKELYVVEHPEQMELEGGSVSVEIVTPAMAQAWLNSNTNNRRFRGGIAERYASDMRAGNWTQCTAPICIYESGEIADGQHRLWALIDSNTSQTFLVLRGLKETDGLNIDTGFGRTLADAGKIAGIPDDLSPRMVAAARGIASGATPNMAMSNAQKLACVTEFRAPLAWALKHMPRSKYVCNSVYVAAVGRAWFYEQERLPLLARFCEVMGTGFSDGAHESAAIALRNYALAEYATSSIGPNWRSTFLRSMSAIKYFMRGRPLTQCRVVSDEIYPLPKAFQTGQASAALAAAVRANNTGKHSGGVMPAPGGKQ